jgi:hypothetical protein
VVWGVPLSYGNVRQDQSNVEMRNAQLARVERLYEGHKKTLKKNVPQSTFPPVALKWAALARNHGSSFGLLARIARGARTELKETLQVSVKRSAE